MLVLVLVLVAFVVLLAVVMVVVVMMMGVTGPQPRRVVYPLAVLVMHIDENPWCGLLVNVGGGGEQRQRR